MDPEPETFYVGITGEERDILVWLLCEKSVELANMDEDADTPDGVRNDIRNVRAALDLALLARKVMGRLPHEGLEAR